MIWDGLSWWDRERVVMQGIVLCLFIHVILKLKKLLKQGVEDRHARMFAIDELKKTAIALKEETARLAVIVLGRESSTAEAIGGRFDKIDRELVRNSELTRTAATASALAAEVANSVNDKISQTNDRLLEHVESAEKKGGA